MTERPEGGFTLLEVLVSLVILGFLVAGLAGGVRLGVRGWDQQARAQAADAELDAVDRALRQLVAQVYPGDRTHPAGLAGTAGELRISTVLPQAVSGVEGDAVLSAGNGVLSLRWRPRAPGVPSGPPPSPQATELLSGVVGLQIGYWGPNGWQDAWNNADLPALVRIAILFPADDPAGRRWPPIVAAPARSREAR